MGVHLVIDGYNLLHEWLGPGIPEAEFEDARLSLIKRLAEYKLHKKIKKVSLVFDATYTRNLTRETKTVSGIRITFSRSAEEADQIVKEVARALGPGATIVTSDRDIIEYASDKDAVVLTSREFLDLMEFSEYSGMKGIEDMEDEEETELTYGRKKGPARKSSKKERQKTKRLKKL